MTAPLWLANLCAWWLQAAVLLFVGVATAHLLLGPAPQLRLRLYHLLLLATALLPVLQPWQRLPAPREVVVAAAPLASAPVPITAIATPFDWAQVLLATIFLGATARLAWLALGLVQVSLWRSQGEPIIVEGIAPTVEIRLVDGLRSPASFGWRSPVIILPRDWPDGPRRHFAILHELEHTLRRDWLWCLGEQIFAALFWFHPAVWWILSRIHLSREQAVDAAVAELDRDQYLATLLASAGLPDTAAWPAPSFLSRRHLLARVAHLTHQETPMSMPRLAAAASAALALTFVALSVATTQFPLRAQAPASGTVVLDLTVNDKGEVEDVRVVSGPAELRPRAIRDAVRSSYPPGPRTRQLKLDFNDKVPGTPPPPPQIDQAELVGIDYTSLPLALQERITPLTSNLRTGQRFTSAELDQLSLSLVAIDPSLRLRKRISGLAATKTGYALRLIIMADEGIPPPTVIRVGGNLQAANLAHKVEPEYPPLALQARIQGTVRFNVYLTAEGTVERAVVVSGHPLLVPAATEAVSQYRYKPTTLNGKPVSIQTQVDIDFKL